MIQASYVAVFSAQGARKNWQKCKRLAYTVIAHNLKGE